MSDDDTCRSSDDDDDEQTTSKKKRRLTNAIQWDQIPKINSLDSIADIVVGNDNCDHIVDHDIDLWWKEFLQWIQQVQDILSDVQWNKPHVDSSSKSMICYNQEFPASVTTWESDSGDKMQLWQTHDDHDENDDKWQPMSSYGFLQTSTEDYLIVGYCGAHPHVVCNLFEFADSGGTTAEQAFQLDTQDGNRILQQLFDRAKQYCGEYVREDSSSPSSDNDTED